MRIPFFALVVLAGAFIFAPFAASAEEYGTKEEAKAMVEAVIAYFDTNGAEETFAKTSSQEMFQNKDLYPFIYTLEGEVVAHGAKEHLVGKNLYDLKDQDGKLMIQEMAALAKTGEMGWVDFKWPHPTTNEIMDKSGYIAPLGDEYFVGVGIYKYE